MTDAADIDYIAGEMLEAAHESVLLYSIDGLTGDALATLNRVCSLACYSGDMALRNGDSDMFADAVEKAMIVAFQVGRRVERGEYK